MSENREVNNAFYDSLKERWYTADDDPVALLRAESRLRNPWVLETLSGRIGKGCHRVLDVGCGGGFLSNPLARAGHIVHGIDLSEESLRIARQVDRTRTVEYRKMDATRLGYRDASFDAVCAMDFLEHVENPLRVIGECERVLRPGGIFLFYTFNRNWLSWLLAIKCVEWFVRNTPERMHIYRYFIRPDELSSMCAARGLKVERMNGVGPELLSAAIPRLLWSGRVPASFRFKFTRSKLVGYCGVASKGYPACNA